MASRLILSMFEITKIEALFRLFYCSWACTENNLQAVVFKVYNLNIQDYSLKSSPK